MFNLIMGGIDWSGGQETMPVSRFFEYTDDHIADQFRQNRSPILERLIALPCLFMPEGREDEFSYVGQVNRARVVGADVMFEYSRDPDVPPLRNSLIYENRKVLGMPRDFEFWRNHWAVKDVDLYRFLLRSVRPRRQRPTVFAIDEHENIDPALAAAMMPFAAGFDAVYESIRQASENVGLCCKRADNIWEHAVIIQDVVSLIDRSRIVICDCSGRNPNVFYEAGIAHALGRDVVLITQNEHDIPFDLQHLRYIKYLNNAEGRSVLATALQGRIQTILDH